MVGEGSGSRQRTLNIISSWALVWKQGTFLWMPLDLEEPYGA